MKPPRHQFVFLTACALAAAATPAGAKDFRLYYLGGQSNMDGYGLVAELPAGLRSPEGYAGVYIFHGNQGLDGQPADGKGRWSKLAPGHGRGFVSDGETNTYSECFGPELTFGAALRKAYPDDAIALVKYSRGGTSIDAEAPAAVQFGAWEPDWDGGEGDGAGINQYDHFLATLVNARADADIDGDGEADRLVPAGVIWMQGESDAGTEEVAGRYRENLAGLVGLVRQALGGPDPERIPAVIGRITDWEVWEFGAAVRQAQAAFAEADPHATLVTSTDGYGASDDWHYDTAGYIDLGNRFAEAVVRLAEGEGEGGAAKENAAAAGGDLARRLAEAGVEAARRMAADGLPWQRHE